MTGLITFKSSEASNVNLFRCSKSMTLHIMIGIRSFKVGYAKEFRLEPVKGGGGASVSREGMILDLEKSSIKVLTLHRWSYLHYQMSVILKFVQIRKKFLTNLGFSAIALKQLN